MSDPEALAEGDRLLERLPAGVGVLAELDQPSPVNSGQSLRRLIGRLIRVGLVGTVRHDRFAQSRHTGTTGTDGVDILESTDNVVPTAHLVSIGRHIRIVPLWQRHGAFAPNPASHGGLLRAMGRRHQRWRASACTAGRGPPRVSVISLDQ